MASVLHVIDQTTPADCLDQLAMLEAGPPVVLHRREGTAFLSGRLIRSAIRKLIRDAKIVHAWSLPAARAAVATARGTQSVLLSVPCVPRSGHLGELLKIIDRGLAGLTVPTEASRRALLQAGLPGEVVHVLPPPARPIEDFEARRKRTREQLGLGETERLLTAPSRMIRHAGQRHACWVHAILRQITPDVRLLLPGRGPFESHVRFFAATTGYDDEVFLTEDRYTRDDVLAAADVAVFFHESRHVGIGALAAAMAAGLPIAAAQTPEIAECAPDGQAALLARPGDHRRSSAAVLKLLEQPVLARRLAAAASRRANENFTPARCRRRLDEIYGLLD